MVRIQSEYQGDLHCTSVHTPSKTELATDAPVDNQGRGESFSPTDLIATSLGTCMLTTMGTKKVPRSIPAAISPIRPKKQDLAQCIVPLPPVPKFGVIDVGIAGDTGVLSVDGLNNSD